MNTFIQKRLPRLATVLTAFALCSASARGAGGTVVAWGDGIFYQTGNYVPVTLTNAIAIGAALSNSLALKADGHLVNWGSDSSPALNFTNVVAVAGGGSHYLLLTADGIVDSFGSWAGRSRMPADVFNATNIVAISAGGFHDLVLKSDGTVLAWGGDTYCGQTNVPAGLSNVTAIACGGYHSLALRSDGTVVAWGAAGTLEDFGQSIVPAGLSGVVAIAAGACHSLALKSDGTVVAWGGNYAGQTNAPADLSHVVAIAAGLHHSLALKSDGTVVTWGSNFAGLTNSNVIAIASGPESSIALAIVGTAPPACQVPLANSSFGPHGFSVSVPTRSGRTYALEYQDALSNGPWTTLPLAAGNGGTLTLKHPTAAGTQRFYRVRQW